MEYENRFKNETGKDTYIEFSEELFPTPEYVDWLESQLKRAEGESQVSEVEAKRVYLCKDNYNKCFDWFYSLHGNGGCDGCENFKEPNAQIKMFRNGVKNDPMEL